MSNPTTLNAPIPVEPLSDKGSRVQRALRLAIPRIIQNSVEFAHECVLKRRQSRGLRPRS